MLTLNPALILTWNLNLNINLTLTPDADNEADSPPGLECD